MKYLVIVLLSMLILTGCNKDSAVVQPQSTNSGSAAKIKAIVSASSTLTITIYRFSNSTLLSTITVKSGDTSNLFYDNFIVASDGSGNPIYYNLDQLVLYIPYVRNQRLELYF